MLDERRGEEISEWCCVIPRLNVTLQTHRPSSVQAQSLSIVVEVKPGHVTARARVRARAWHERKKSSPCILNF